MKKSILLLFIITLVGCKKNPLQELHNQARNFGFHPFTLPLEDIRPGTLVAGTESNLHLVASSNACFPSESEDYFIKSYKSIDNYQDSFTFELNLSTQIDAKLASGLGLGLKFSMAKKAIVRLSDLRLRALEVPRILKYINSLTEDNPCKNLILESRLGMIGEIIEANMIDIQFVDAAGMGITIDPDYISKYINLKEKLEWSLIDNKKIHIVGPKGIGHKLYLFGIGKDNLAHINYMTSGKTNNRGSYILEPFRIDQHPLYQVQSTKVSPVEVILPIRTFNETLNFVLSK